MTPAPEIVEFWPPDWAVVVDAMDGLARAQKGWITLQPGVHPDEVPPARSVLGQLFSGLGPPVPVGTWVAPEPKQKPPHPELGLLHKAGPKAVRKLGEAGLAVPDHWVVLADHPRRGLVIAIHPETPNGEVLEWIIEAATKLTQVPLTGSWQASINGRA